MYLSRVFGIIGICLLTGMSPGFAQIIIWQEDFTAYPDGTLTGPDWDATQFGDCDDPIGNNGTSFQWGVFNEEFVVNDSEGQICCSNNGDNSNTLLIGPIDISGYFGVEIDFDFTANGDYECLYDQSGLPCPQPDSIGPLCDPQGHDQAIFEYSVDGSPFNVFGYWCGDQFCFGQPFFCGGIVGNNLTIRVQAGNQANGETYTIDNFVVSGFQTPIAEAEANGNIDTLQVCPGENVQLNETGGTASAWSWMGPNSFTSSQQNPLITDFSSMNAGLYIVEVMTPAGCTDTAIVEIQSKPTPTTNTMTLEGCGPTATFDLTAVEGTVTNGAPGAVVDWFLDANATIPINNPSNVQFSSSTMVYAVVTLDGCTSEPQAVSLIVIPTSDASWTPPSGLCDNGEAITLSPEGDTGGSWTGPLALTDNGDGTAAFDPQASGAGTFSVTYAVGTNPCADTVTQSITVNPGADPAWTVPSAACIGQPNNEITLVPDGTPGGNWSGTGVTDNGDGTAIFDPDVPGAGSVTYTVGTPPCDTFLTQTITLTEVTATVGNILCSNNGTPADTTDDTYTAEIQVNGTNVGSGWTANDPNTTAGSYGASELFGPYPISGGDITFDIVDEQTGCLTTVTLVAPPVLSPVDTIVDMTASCNPADTGVSTVVLTNNAGCDSVVFITTTTLLPTDTIMEMSSSCSPADTGVSTMVLTNSSGCDSIVITTVSLLPTDTITELLSSCHPADTGVSTVVLTNSSGCDSVVITTTTLLPTPETTIDPILCFGDSIEINGTWYDRSNPTGMDTLTAANGCDSVLNISVSFYPAPTLETISQELCEGESIVVNGTMYDENTPSGQEVVLAQTGCDSVIITVNLSFSGLEIEASTEAPTCAGDQNGQILIEAISGGTPPYLFSLDGQLFQPVGTLPFVRGNLPAGSYTLTIQDVNGCEGSANVQIQEGQEPALDLGLDEDAILGEEVTVTALLNFDYTEIVWTPAFIDTCQGCTDLVKSFVATQSLTITATASDSVGCRVTDELRVRVNRDRQVYAPNVFSPNGDGINDLFFISGNSNQIVNINSLLVFDRWGEKVFELTDIQPNDPANGWDGTFKAELLDPGVFIYYAEIEFVDGATEVFSGDLTLVK